MKVGMIGLGRMGGNMARRLIAGGHDIVAFDQDPAAVADVVKDGAQGATSLADMAGKLDRPGIWWVMLPAGPITEGVIAQICAIATDGDIVLDGGNGYFKDDVRRARELGQQGLLYLDVGVSGGVWGKDRGYCLMIGGPTDAVELLDPVFLALAPGIGTIPRTPNVRLDEGEWRAENGYVHTGPAGSGHFTKMIHNGIEYGMMQAYAEGFDVLRQRNLDTLPDGERFDLNLSDIAEVWRRDGGSRPGRRPRRQPVRTLPQPDRGKLRRPDAVRDALRLRRPRRNPAMTPATRTTP